jgi:hypothetical protein
MYNNDEILLYKALCSKKLVGVKLGVKPEKTAPKPPENMDIKKPETR